MDHARTTACKRPAAWGRLRWCALCEVLSRRKGSSQRRRRMWTTVGGCLHPPRLWRAGLRLPKRARNGRSGRQGCMKWLVRLPWRKVRRRLHRPQAPQPRRFLVMQAHPPSRIVPATPQTTRARRDRHLQPVPPIEAAVETAVQPGPSAAAAAPPDSLDDDVVAAAEVLCCVFAEACVSVP